MAPPGRLGDSGLFYDAVGLEHDAGGKYRPNEIAAEVRPTIFYKSSADGLREIVEVYVKFGEHPRSGLKVRFGAGNFTSTQRFRPDRDFGQQKMEFEVPESQVAKKGEVSVSMNGRSILVPIQLTPAKKVECFRCAVHEHVDIGYSDFQAKTYEVQSRALDQAIETIQEHPSFRYTLDGNWVAEQYLKTRSAPQREKFLDLVKENKIYVPANYYFNLLTGFASSEEIRFALCIRGTSFSKVTAAGLIMPASRMCLLIVGPMRRC